MNASRSSSSCHTYSLLSCGTARLPTKSPPRTKIPTACPFCNSPDRTHFIWKHNAVTRSQRSTSPQIPGANPYILTGTQLAEADLDATKSYRKRNNLMGSDDFPEGVGFVKDRNSRAPSASSTGGLRKNPRPEQQSLYRLASCSRYLVGPIIIRGAGTDGEGVMCIIDGDLGWHQGTCETELESTFPTSINFPFTSSHFQTLCPPIIRRTCHLELALFSE